MERPTTLFISEDRAASASCTEEAGSLGTVQSFIDLEELRRLLARLATVELVRMFASETFG